MQEELLPASPDATPDRTIDLGKWLGRREAFGLIAGRCSAAEAESLKKIRDEKLYLELSPNWDKFCSDHLHASRRNVDRQIHLLNEFGPAYFHLSQLTRVSPAEYRTIAAHVTEEGVKVEGEVIALLPENTRKVSDAVAKLKRRTADGEEKTKAFASVIKRCEAAAAALEACPKDLDRPQKQELAAVLFRLRHVARAAGVPRLELWL